MGNSIGKNAGKVAAQEMARGAENLSASIDRNAPVLRDALKEIAKSLNNINFVAGIDEGTRKTLADLSNLLLNEIKERRHEYDKTLEEAVKLSFRVQALITHAFDASLVEVAEWRTLVDRLLTKFGQGGVLLGVILFATFIYQGVEYGVQDFVNRLFDTSLVMSTFALSAVAVLWWFHCLDILFAHREASLFVITACVAPLFLRMLLGDHRAINNQEQHVAVVQRRRAVREVYWRGYVAVVFGVVLSLRLIPERSPEWDAALATADHSASLFYKVPMDEHELKSPKFNQGLTVSYGTYSISDIKYQCADEFLEWDNSCYLFGPADKTYFDAGDYCQRKGSSLVHVNDLDEHEMIRNKVKERFGKHLKIWIDLRRDASGGFVWGNGDPLTFRNWAPGQPDQLSEGCVHLYNGGGGKWNDIPCTNTCSVVCESKREPVLHSRFWEGAINAVLDTNDPLIDRQWQAGVVPFQPEHPNLFANSSFGVIWSGWLVGDGFLKHQKLVLRFKGIANLKIDDVQCLEGFHYTLRDKECFVNQYDGVHFIELKLLAIPGSSTSATLLMQRSEVDTRLEIVPPSLFRR